MIDITLIKNGGTMLRDFVSALAHPLKSLSDGMNTKYSDISIRSFYNGRKMVLQNALNTIFGQAANYIYIDWNRDPSVFGVYNASESLPTFVFNSVESTPLFIFNDGEIQDSEDFIVYIPNPIYTADLDKQIKAEVNKYKAVGTTFITDTYTP